MKKLKPYEKPQVEAIAMVPPTPIAQSPEFSAETGGSQPSTEDGDFDTPFDNVNPSTNNAREFYILRPFNPWESALTQNP